MALPSCALLAVEIQLSHLSPLCTLVSTVPPSFLPGNGWRQKSPWQQLEALGQAAFSFGRRGWLIPTKVSHKTSYWDLGEGRSKSVISCASSFCPTSAESGKPGISVSRGSSRTQGMAERATMRATCSRPSPAGGCSVRGERGDNSFL